MSPNEQPVVSNGVSAAELAKLGEGRRALRRGQILEMTPAGFQHGRITNTIAYHLTSFVEAHGLGVVLSAETGFLLEKNPDTVLAPDVAFVSRDRPLDVSGYAEGAPDLAVEVVSPHDRRRDVTAKVRQWLAHGAQQVWVVDPRRRCVEIHESETRSHTLDSGATLLGGELFPGFALPIAKIFGPKSE